MKYVRCVYYSVLKGKCSSFAIQRCSPLRECMPRQHRQPTAFAGGSGCTARGWCIRVQISRGRSHHRAPGEVRLCAEGRLGHALRSLPLRPICSQPRLRRVGHLLWSTPQALVCALQLTPSSVSETVRLQIIAKKVAPQTGNWN